MKQKKVHLALVVSEYGKLLGLVTMDDLLALLFGDINDERDTLQRAVRRGRGGRTPPPGSLPTIDQSTPVPRLTETALLESAASSSTTTRRRTTTTRWIASPPSIERAAPRSAST